MPRYSREMILVAVVFENLMHHVRVLDTVDEQLVVAALRRSNLALSDAGLSELGDYLSSLDTESLRGLASNVKGIYHELKYVHAFNATHDDQVAELFPNTNHPGSDVLIRDVETGEVIREIQLKASDSVTYALRSAPNDPNIERLGTHEIAESSQAIGDSGFFNADLTQDVRHQFDQVADCAPGAQVIEATETASLISAALRGYEILQGDATPAEGVKKFGLDVAIATGTTALVALLFS